MFKVQFFVIFALLSVVQSANILGVFPLNVKSHYVMFEKLVKGLAEKGHNVDVVTHFPSKDAPLRLNQLSLAGTLPDYRNNLSISVVEHFSHYQIVEFMTKPNGVGICATLFQTPLMQKLRHSPKKYDLIITEIFGSDCMLGFGYLFKAPVVSMISSVALPWADDRVGNPNNPAYIPTYFGSFAAKMSLYERIQNTYLLLASKILYSVFSSKDSNAISKGFFGEDLPPLEQLANNISLILVNSHYSFSFARPTVPNFVEVGGIHIQEPRPLSNLYEEILNNSNGVIVLTMGSMVLTETFDVQKLQAMFDAFATFPHTVLWKATREKFPKELKIPENVRFESWMPQTDILCHPNVRLFVSHGGLMGFQETVYCGVPLLGMPLFADQIHNIHLAERLGIGKKVAYQDITKELMLEALRELLHNETYQSNVDRISRQFKDRPMTPLETAIFWVEYVMRHNGAPQLRSVGADLLWYQYYLLDVAAVTVSLCVFLLFLAKVFLQTFASSKTKTD